MTIVEAVTNWANANQGVLALAALFVSVPTLLVLVYQVSRKIFPSRTEVERKIKNDFEHAANMKREIEGRVKWDDGIGYFGEFLVRDASRKLPETNETHSAATTPYSILVLTKIHPEYLELTSGNFSIRYIKKIADGWYFCDRDEEGALMVTVVVRLAYRDVVTIRWETNEYWEWPQICCRFTKSNRFPFTNISYAREEILGARKTLIEVCSVESVQERPKGWV